MPIPTAIYCRASSQDQTTSVPQQVQAAEEFAPSHNLKIIARYIDDGISGTRFETRPAVRQLLRDVEHKPKFSVLLVYDQSRFGRISPREAIYWKHHLERHGVRLRLIHTHADVDDEFASFVLQGIEMGEAREYALKLGRATIRGQLANASEGFYTGGRPPFGYRRVAVNQSSGRIIRELPSGVRRRQKEEKVILALGDKDEVKVVRRIFELRLAGLGFPAIAALLTKEGVPRPGKCKRQGMGDRWSWLTVKSIVENPAYHGASVFNRRSESRLTGSMLAVRQNDPGDWIIRENRHPAIVSKSLWQKANSRERQRCPSRNRFSLWSSYLLSDLMVCRCGSRFHGITKPVKTTGERCGFYIEADVHSGTGKCKRVLFDQHHLEREVVDKVASFLQSGKWTLRGKQGASTRAARKHIIGFARDYDTIREKTPAYLLKNMLGQFIQKIIVDPATRRVTVAIRRTPRLNPSDETDSTVKCITFHISKTGT